jgi:hypothetical protein
MSNCDKKTDQYENKNIYDPPVSARYDDGSICSMVVEYKKNDVDQG